MRSFVDPTVCLGLVAGLGALTPTQGHAGEPASPGAGISADGPELPWGKRRGSLGVGAGVSISSSLTVVTPGLRGGYYVVDGLELGGEVELGVLMWSAADFTAHPGLASTAPGLALRVTPTLRYVFLRQPGFSPYLLAGAGPTIWNHGAGVAGHWTASPGALIYLGGLGGSGGSGGPGGPGGPGGSGGRTGSDGGRGAVYLDLAIRFSGTFPGRSCHGAFTVGGADVPGYCGFQFGPRLGFTVAF